MTFELAFAVRLMEHLVVPTFVLDYQGRVLIWNRACERLTGLSAKEVVGTSDHWRGFYDAPRHCLADILALGRTDDLADLYTEHTIHKDVNLGLFAETWCVMPLLGKRLYLAVDAGPIHDEHGKLIAVVETLRDMTEQKLAQMALQSLAVKDGLTGIANRRSFDDTLAAEWLRAQREQTSLSLLIADVDFFKLFNDAYGHQKGDDCLRSVAGIIDTKAFRPADLAARYGGEEFAVIMPTTDAAGAFQVAERIREAVFAQNMAHAESPSGRVTLSIGVATLVPSCSHNPAMLISFADKSLYEAKHAGRDRVVCANMAAATPYPRPGPGKTG
jgi:diguanylate cyclase (GGDEF)-like protein